MLSLLLKCIHCHGSLAGNALPLCQTCADGLIDCPPLCCQCASPLCFPHSFCQRPWIQGPKRSGIKSFRARYLCVGQSYRVLKTWKIDRGVLLNQVILGPRGSKLEGLARTSFDFIIPIPHSLRRSLRLRGSPAEELGRLIAERLRLPLLALLRSPEHGPRQAQQSLSERIAGARRFELKSSSSVAGKRALLVDDFLTSGRTVSAAARVLKNAGASEVHVFCLGYRPRRTIQEIQGPKFSQGES